MKKKIVAICAIAALLAVAIVSGTLAYFNDKEEATNTFTVGNVDIILNETNHDGSDYDSSTAKNLFPGDAKSPNAVAKNVTVTVKESSADSWVWVEILIPAPLYASKDASNESNNALHFNQFKNFLQGYKDDSSNPHAIECAKYYNNSDHQWSVAQYIDEVTINDVKYARLRTTHKDIVKGGVQGGTSTSPAMSQVYMDKNVQVAKDATTGEIKKDTSGNIVYVLPDGVTEYSGNWEIIVQAFAMQAQGFTSVEDAVTAFYVK